MLNHDVSTTTTATTRVGLTAIYPGQPMGDSVPEKHLLTYKFPIFVAIMQYPYTGDDPIYN